MALRFGVMWLASLLVGLAGCGDNAAEAPAVGLQSIAITPVLLVLDVGTSLQLTATGTDADGQTMDVSTMVNWASAATSIAKVGPTGLLTGVGPGDIAITASRGGVVGTTTATVTAVAPVSLSVFGVANLGLGQTEGLTAIGTYSDGSQVDLARQVRWSSDNAACLPVSPDGVVRARAIGFATITATLGAITGALPMSVGPPVPISVEIVADPPGPLQVKLGDLLQLSAIAMLSDFTTQRLAGDAVVWFSQDDAIAIVDAAGLVTPVRVGTVTVGFITESLLSLVSVDVLAAD